MKDSVYSRIRVYYECRSSLLLDRKGVNRMDLWNNLFSLVSSLIVAWFTWWLNRRPWWYLASNRTTIWAHKKSLSLLALAGGFCDWTVPNGPLQLVLYRYYSMFYYWTEAYSKAIPRNTNKPNKTVSTIPVILTPVLGLEIRVKEVPPNSSPSIIMTGDE